MLAGRWAVDDFVFEDPGEVVRDEDCVETGGEGRVDVRPGGVADHPGGGGVAGVMLGKCAVGFVVLFRENFDAGEKGTEAGAVQLVDLLVVIALGDEDKAVTAAQLVKGFVDAREKLDLLFRYGIREGDDAIVALGGDGLVRKLLEAGDEGATEAGEAVSMLRDGGALAEIEVLADFFAGVDAMVQVADKGGDGSLKVDVVFP